VEEYSSLCAELATSLFSAQTFLASVVARIISKYLRFWAEEKHDA